MPKYRHLKRYREIVNCVVLHGLGHLVTQPGLAQVLPAARRSPEAEA